MQLAFDAIITGAGPAGSTAAILLARAGWSVGLVEKQAFPRRKVCGECIAGSNLPLLDDLGIGTQLATSAGPALRQVALMQGRHMVVADLPACRHARHQWGRAVGRERLDTLLLKQARAAGAVILQPWAVRSLSGAAGDFSCVVRSVDSGATAILRAPVAIAASGSWEALPAIGGNGRRPLRANDLLAFKANFSGGALAEGLLPIISFRGGYGGMVIADNRVLTLACCIRADRLDELRRRTPGLSAGRVVEAMLRRDCTGVERALAPAGRIGPWLATGPLRPGIHLRADDGVFRVGNAAGEAHPIIGEGISMAMQSAWMLCKHLIGAGNPHGALYPASTWPLVHARYEADWRRIFARRLHLAAAFAHVAMRPFLFAPGLPWIRHLAPLLKPAAVLSGKVNSVLDLEGYPS